MSEGKHEGKREGSERNKLPLTRWVYPVHVCDIFCTCSTDIRNNKTVVKHCYDIGMNVYRLLSCLFLPTTARVAVEIGN